MSWLITGTQKEPPSPYLLDTFPDAAAAYSLRQLRTGNTNVVRVRRSSDNTEADFTATQVSNGTLATWVGAGNNGFVRTWYDQSGNNRHCQQSDTAAQPYIVSNGVLETFSGKPSLNFATSRFFNRITTTAPLRSFTFLAKARAPEETLQIVGSHLGLGTLFSSFVAYGAASSNLTGESLTFYDGNTTASFLSAGYAFTNGQNAINSAFFTAANNGLIIAQGSTPALISNAHSVANADFQIGKRIDLEQYYDSFLPEWIMWSVNYGASGLAIHANINAHYAIY